MNYILFVTKQSLTQVSSSIMHFAYFYTVVVVVVWTFIQSKWLLYKKIFNDLLSCSKLLTENKI